MLGTAVHLVLCLECVQLSSCGDCPVYTNSIFYCLFSGKFLNLRKVIANRGNSDSNCSSWIFLIFSSPQLWHNSTSHAQQRSCLQNVKNGILPIPLSGLPQPLLSSPIHLHLQGYGNWALAAVLNGIVFPLQLLTYYYRNWVWTVLPAHSRKLFKVVYHMQCACFNLHYSPHFPIYKITWTIWDLYFTS